MTSDEQTATRSPGQSEPILLLRLLCSGIQNTRGGISPPPLLERLLDAWLSTASTVEVHAKGLTCANETLEQDGGWSFYMFMTGLRSLQITPTASLADLQRLLVQLAAFRFNANASDAFRSWAWEEDGEAFRFSLQRSFSETLDSDELDPHVKATSFAALRTRSFAPAGQDNRISSQLLDQATSRPELNIDIGAYARASINRDHEVNGAAMTTVIRALANASAWAVAELGVSMSLGNLGELDPLRLSRQIALSLASGDPSRAMEALARLSAEDPQLAGVVRKQLNPEDIVEGLLKGSLSRLPPPALTSWIGSEDPLGLETLLPLLRKATENPRAANLTKAILQDPRAAKKLEDAASTLDEVSPELGAWLGQNLRPENLRTFLETASPDTAATVLSSLPPEQILSRFEGSAARAIASGSARTRTTLAVHLASSDTGPKQLATMLQTAATAPWSARAAALLCGRIQSAGLAKETLLPLALNAAASPPLRAAALRALQSSPHALREASKWTVRELWAPREVKRALQAARKHLKSTQGHVS